jgi:hypothetical protein
VTLFAGGFLLNPVPVSERILAFQVPLSSGEQLRHRHFNGQRYFAEVLEVRDSLVVHDAGEGGSRDTGLFGEFRELKFK